MKTFYVVLAVFAVLLALILGNALYVNQTATALKEQLPALSNAEDATAALTALERYWERRRTVISLSVPTESVWLIDERLTEIRSAVVRQDADDLDVALRLALDAVTRMQSTEGLSVDILF